MDFGDIVQIGAQMAQLAKLRQLQEQVAAIESQKLETLQLQFIQNEIKERIFQYSQLADKLEKAINNNPMQVYVYTKILISNMKAEGISTTLFSNFQDKEYVTATLRKFENILVYLQQQMNIAQLDNCEHCSKVLESLPILEDALIKVRAKEKLESLAQQQNEVDKSKKSTSEYNTKLNTSFRVAGVIWEIIFFCTLMAITQSAFIFWVWTLLNISGIAIGFAVYHSLIKKFPYYYNHLDQEIRILQNTAALNNVNVWNQIKQHFEGKNSTELTVLLAHWKKEVAEVMGDSFLTSKQFNHNT